MHFFLMNEEQSWLSRDCWGFSVEADLDQNTCCSEMGALHATRAAYMIYMSPIALATGQKTMTNDQRNTSQVFEH